MSTLREITLVPASVRDTATFGDAAHELAGSRLAAIAVVGEDERVVGLFTEEDMLEGVFPAYLRELKHTAFVEDDPAALTERAVAVRGEPIAKHMRKAITVDLDTSATHAAELFLHHEEAALAVVEHERFVGMLPRAELCLATLRRLTEIQ